MFGKLIYDNFIFDIPKMMDLCVLYGPTNSVLLSKMFKNIFVNQPKYKYDLEETAKGLIQVLSFFLNRKRDIINTYVIFRYFNSF